MKTASYENEILAGFRRGNDALLEIANAKGPRSQWMVGACLAARARVRVVLAALEANEFFSTMLPVWLDRAEQARLAGNHARRSYYLCLANAARDAMADAMSSARGNGMHKTIVWLDSSKKV